MKRKLILFYFIFSLFIFEKTFSYTESSFRHVYMWSIYSEQNAAYTYDKNLTLNNINIKRTQDNDYYYFTIKADAFLNNDLKNVFVNYSRGFGSAITGYTEYYGWCGPYVTGSDNIVPNSIGETHVLVPDKLKPMLYGEKDFTNKQIIKNCNFDISNGGNIYRLYENVEIGGKEIAFYLLNEKGTEDKGLAYHYIPYPVSVIQNYYGISDDPYYHNIGVTRHLKLNDNIPSHDGLTIISNTCSVKTCTYDSYDRINDLVYTLSTEIKIKKDMFNYYRYFAYGGLNFLTNAKYCNDFVSEYRGVFSSTNTIDLNNYVNCNHSWEYTINGDNHNKYCKNCEWSIIESHNTIYEYDGIKNNLCECGYKKKVNYTFDINDDNITTIIKTYDTNSIYTKYEVSKKTGYTFKEYERYEKQYKNPSNPVYSSTSTELNIVKLPSVSSMTEKTTNLSTIYKAIYTPNKYTFVFSNTNNLGIILPSTIEKQVYTYDVEQKIKDGQKINGYKFKGWTNIKNSSEVKFIGGELIKNYSAINNDEIMLYPVYTENEYIIRYSNKNKYNKGIEAISDQQIKYSKKEKLKKAYRIEGYIFKGWSRTYGSEKIDFVNEEEIIKISHIDKEIITLFPIYEPIKYIIKYSGKSNIENVVLSNLESQICLYDNEYKIKEGIKVEKYKFSGWSNNEMSKKVEYNVGDRIFNYSNINNEIITLYPLYHINDIKINYYTSKGRYSKNSNEAVQNVIFDDNTELLLPYDYSSDESYFTYYKTNLDNNTYTEMKEVKKLLEEKNITNITLYACFDKNQYGKIERTVDGFVPQAGGGFNKKNIIINNEENVTKNIVKEESKQNKKQKRIKKKTNEKEKNEIDIEIYDMTKSEWKRIYEILGIKEATFSSILRDNKYEIYGNINMIKALLYIMRYRKQILLSVILIVLISIIIMVKKKK